MSNVVTFQNLDVKPWIVNGTTMEPNAPRLGITLGETGTILVTDNVNNYYLNQSLLYVNCLNGQIGVEICSSFIANTNFPIFLSISLTNQIAYLCKQGQPPIRENFSGWCTTTAKAEKQNPPNPQNNPSYILVFVGLLVLIIIVVLIIKYFSSRHKK